MFYGAVLGPAKQIYPEKEDSICLSIYLLETIIKSWKTQYGMTILKQRVENTNLEKDIFRFV